MVLEVLVFMLSLNCSADFEPDYWAGFDVAMTDEWNIGTTTDCYQIDEFPANFSDYIDLKNEVIIAVAATGDGPTRISNNTDSIDFTSFIDNLLLYHGNITSDQKIGSQQQQVVFVTEYSKSVFQIENASGVAYPSNNIAFVRSDTFYTVKALNHEILHLVLEEEGHPDWCYIDKVHEGQSNLSVNNVVENGHVYRLIGKFEC